MAPPTTSTSKSTALTRKGDQTLHARTKAEKERAVVLPSTARAMQLRNGKGGSFGTGELVKLSGRSKMELIAEDEMRKARELRKERFAESAQGALRAPFNMEVAKKVAQSQMDAFIDTINHLHSSDLCYDIVSEVVIAQGPPRRSSKDPDPLKSPAFVAEQFAILVHNSYMLASGWTIVYESLKLLEREGLEDKTVLNQLRNDNKMRTVYLLAYNLIKKLVSASQQRLRSIVQNTEHYSRYFKASLDARGQQVFDIHEIRQLNKSYLDSAIVELCLPGSEFSPQALYHILNTVEQETPKQLKRCPQIMWDTVGDLAEAVRLLDLMEMPLVAADGQLQSSEDLGTFAEFVQWDEAQEKSIHAALDISSIVNLVHPLTNVKSKITLEKVWDRLNGSYVRASGKTIDALWQLVDVRVRVPHFSVLYVPSEVLGDSTQASTQRSKPLVITQGEDGYDSNDSMPGLMAVSDSEEDEEPDDYLATDSSEEEETEDSDEYSDEDEESDEDEDFKIEMGKQYRRAMDIFNEMPDMFDQPPQENDKYANERKSNPFLLLLGKLRGRMFSSTSALRTDGKTTQTTKPVAPKPKKPVAKPTSTPPAPDKIPPLEPIDAQYKKTRQTTVEDADDESDEGRKADKKKKKKKPKKKKKAAGTTMGEVADSPTVETSTTPLPSQIPLRSAEPESKSPSSPNSKKQQSPARSSPSSVHSNLSGTTASGSTVSLPLPTEQKAESARKYLAEAGLDQVKTKIKTRPDQPNEQKEDKVGRPRLFGRFGGGSRESDKKDSSSASAVFGRLKHKTSMVARKVFGASAQDKKGSVKWEQFLQVMRELGFSYDPSTAGSSVRFDPPNPNDRSITFHKPHPDPTLYQYKLRDIRAKLRDYYGFTFEQFDNAVHNIGRAGDELED